MCVCLNDDEYIVQTVRPLSGYNRASLPSSPFSSHNIIVFNYEWTLCERYQEPTSIQKPRLKQNE